jgi:hypothetical protein
VRTRASAAIAEFARVHGRIIPGCRQLPHQRRGLRAVTIADRIFAGRASIAASPQHVSADLLPPREYYMMLQCMMAPTALLASKERKDGIVTVTGSGSWPGGG